MGRPFGSVLIANRSEIAVRIIRACREAGLRSIAIYSDADASAMHVRMADEAHRVGPPPPAESYLNAEAILDIARRSGAEGIHPGYGFLAENAEFAERVQRAGMVWIGPSPAAMRLLGDKAAAKALAERVGVPTLAGYHGEAQDDAALAAEAERVGFPILVKAAAGGGGRGMRLVREPAELPEALAAARRESRAAFGDDRLLLERYLERPRHVEMQIFGDEHGQVLYLGERDCSIQRRHQKVIEEAPAPHFSEEQRRAMGEAAVTLARAAGYTNAGTVEFLLDQDGRFYFLEVNTRLQVEHPVTEMVTGLDLVQLQLAVAAGKPLPIRQPDVELKGHAIECRLYAEDPETGFVPSAGRLMLLRWPDSIELQKRVRVDAGYQQGDAVASYYDPLLAKIVARSETRPDAIDVALGALGRVQVTGVRTNLRFLEAVIASDPFIAGHVHTGLVEELGLGGRPILPTDELVVAAATGLVLWGRAEANPGPGPAVRSPWSLLGPWRPGWVGVEIRLQHDDHLINVSVTPPLSADEPWEFRLPDGAMQARVRVKGLRDIHLETERGTVTVKLHRWPQGVTATLGRRSASFKVVSGLGTAPVPQSELAGSTHDLVKSPMPGRVVKLLVKPGDQVKANQTLLVLEAMKIEHLVSAPRDGIVEAVHCKGGDQVELGAELVELED